MEEMMRISGENDAHQWRKSSASVEKVIRISGESHPHHRNKGCG